MRECVNRHRWQTSTIEIRETDATLPATIESVHYLTLSEGLSIREVAARLMMSTATVQKHLKAAPALETCWK